jgi:hypothetical protein
MTPEDRLEIGLIASTLIPVSTLIYGTLWLSVLILLRTRRLICCDPCYRLDRTRIRSLDRARHRSQPILARSLPHLPVDFDLRRDLLRHLRRECHGWKHLASIRYRIGVPVSLQGYVRQRCYTRLMSSPPYVSLFGHAFYENLGLGPGSTLLAGISIILIVPLWVSSRFPAYHRRHLTYFIRLLYS